MFVSPWCLYIMRLGYYVVLVNPDSEFCKRMGVVFKRFTWRGLYLIDCLTYGYFPVSGTF
jgi:hypothetical protein